GPFRAIRYTSLQKLDMDDTNFGWTVQMQARAARRNLRYHEVPTPYRNRIGTSKISGTIRGVYGAGTKILYTIAVEALASLRDRLTQSPPHTILFTRLPTPGQTKTRLIPALGPDAAAQLQSQLTQHTLQQLAPLQPEVRYTSGSAQQMQQHFGRHHYTPQGPGDLGDRLDRAFHDAFAQNHRAAVAVGADCPGLTPAHVRLALRALRTRHIAIGPAHDGGYYLLATKKHHPQLFQNIDWGSDRVLAQTLDAAARLGLSVAQLPPLDDIDRPPDLPLAARFDLLSRSNAYNLQNPAE
ncbi:MAG: TIGR04282 family arsenosugar biosynthesis glycosyltransferase, partial [Desulfobacterales bacterium]|nr:TIGR04282 family arsenosugar biosynthesis glycosyltransferase [Desulfobacterales bacterium]